MPPIQRSVLRAASMSPLFLNYVIRLYMVVYDCQAVPFLKPVKNLLPSRTTFVGSCVKMIAFALESASVVFMLHVQMP